MAAILSIISTIIFVGLGISSCVYVQLQADDTNGNEFVPKRNGQDMLSRIKKILWIQWLGTIVFAVVGGIAVCFLLNYEVGVFSTIRVLAAIGMLYIAAIIDGNIRRIPNVIVGFGVLSGVILLIIEGITHTEDIYEILIPCVGAMIGFGVFFLLLSVVTKHGVGMGDVKLMAALGFLMGLSGTFYTLLFGMLVCLVAAIGLIAFQKKKMKDSVPFGPFIYIGCCIAIIFGMF